MPACCAPNCTSRPEKSSGKTFHAFPRSKPQIFKKWLVNLKRDTWRPSPGSRLCSDHFDKSCFKRAGSRTRLRDDAVPTLFSSPDDSDDAQKNTLKRKAPKQTARIPDLIPESEQPMGPAALFPVAADKMPDHDYAVSDTPEVLKQRLNKCTDAIEKIKKKLKLSEQRERRLKNKVMSLSEIIDDLKGKLLASNDALAMFEKGFSGVPRKLCSSS